MDRVSLPLALSPLGLTTLARADDFALRDSDTVVFPGDCITAARTYGQVTVAYGVNDIGWGMKSGAAYKAPDLAGIRGIVEACK